jgi:hypothetical protein
MTEEPQQPADAEKKDEGIFPEIIEEGERILDNYYPLPLIKKHLDNIIVGEDENKLLIFILLLSGKKWIPYDQKVMIIVKGEPAAGKTTLIDVANVFHTKDVGRFSRHALDYSDLKNFEVLKIKELGAADKEDAGVSTLKFLSADDKGYTAEVTERGEEGQWKTTTYKIPPISMITSTTRIHTDSQLERRSWPFNSDESIDQTERIRLWKINNVKERDEVALGKKKFTSKDFSLLVLKYVVSNLKPCYPIVPFPDSLTNLLGTKTLRVRGDYDKVIVACKLYGILKQRTAFKRTVNDKTMMVLLPDDAVEIVKLMRNPISTMQSGLEMRTIKLIPPLEEMNLNIEGSQISRKDREDIAKKLGLTEPSVRIYFTEWIKRGYMSSDLQRPATYTLLSSTEEILKKMKGLTFTAEEEEELRKTMVDEARKYLEGLW